MLAFAMLEILRIDCALGFCIAYLAESKVVDKLQCIEPPASPTDPRKTV